MADYFNVTTNIGDAEIATAIASNTKLAITHIAFGDGNGAVPTPSKIRTTLVREVHRQPVTKYERHPTNANWIVIETIIPSNVGGFTIREMGIIANGKLISHGSHAPFEKVADLTGVSEYRLKFTQNVRDGNVVEILLDESLIYASQAWVNENYIRRNEIVDNLTTDDATKPVSAKQAKLLSELKVNRGGSFKDAFGHDVDFYQDAFTTQFFKSFDECPIGTRCLISSSLDLINEPLFSDQHIYVETKQTFEPAGKLQIAYGYVTGKVAIRSAGTGAVYGPWTYTATLDSNVASATKLQTPRKINNVEFNGEQDISIDAPLMFRGQINTLNGVDAAVLDGKYTVVDLSVAGLYGYGILVVIRVGGTCHQIFYSHQGEGINNASMAMRQTWNMNGSTASWSEWRIFGTRDDSKLPLTGGTVSGNLRVEGTIDGSLNGNSATATKLQTARTISFSGAATGSVNYDGSGNSSCILTLANSGVVANTYGSNLKIPTITVNAKGLITGVSEQQIPIVDDLTTGGSAKLLSAEQGKLLQANKLDKTALNNTLTSTSSTQALTAAQGKVLNDQAFGVGQTWQDVTSSRVSGTTYTNTTEKAITVILTIRDRSLSTPFLVKIDSLVVIDVDDFYESTYPITFTVAPSSTYQVTTGNTIRKWSELR
ncbi:phage tail protein [Acinetobacter celticus]|uniref:Phage tail fibre protein N-terminal domain-containing protein n=1 Tax=Acinetobacter celticus TaxID=1891224 RepID=A0A1C3CUP3_9GAMM|nr:phage tail protein [Acinetobacter celticus]ODA12438.1 hypothetical protein BBP83_11155 [Acinetobacter celticus]